RECGGIASNLFKYLEKLIKPGITTGYLDKICYEFIKDHGATPSFKGYSDYPASICTSVNYEIIHGLPGNQKLKEGDIIGVDVGVQKNGLISDSAYTFPIGNIKNEVALLLSRTEKSLYLAISKIRNDVRLNDISGAIEDYINQFGYGIVRDYCGHGVGYENHEDPEIPNYRFNGGKRRIKTGTVIAIEPMINMGTDATGILDDGWTVVTRDRKLSAHFEHTIAVTDTGYDVLTILPEDLKIKMEKYL
ncbi:MAG: type I methionyl aminopeptidase, partial [Spirochaetes bacterium RIFOXYB1_FULL_32_8]